MFHRGEGETVCSSCSPTCLFTVILISPVEICHPKSLCKSSKKSNSCIFNPVHPVNLSPCQFLAACGSYWSGTNFVGKCQDKQPEARDQNLLEGVEAQVLVKITDSKHHPLTAMERSSSGSPKEGHFY